MSIDARKQAEDLHEQAQQLDDVDRALALYHQVLALDPLRPTTLYNIGLIHKYRGEWQASFEFNRRAIALAPEDEATNWNLAIAATALNDWRTARKVWNRLGIDVEPGDEPIQDDFGRALTRLDPEGSAEVVWGRRVDPVRLRIENIPLPESGYRCGDIVLHDGAPTGRRMSNGREYQVFNALALHQPSRMSTFGVLVEVVGPGEIEALEALIESRDGALEDWTSSIRMLCKACSEGLPHDHHDELGGDDLSWNPRRRLGVSFERAEGLTEVLAAWEGRDRQVLSWQVALAPPSLS